MRAAVREGEVGRRRDGAGGRQVGPVGGGLREGWPYIDQHLRWKRVNAIGSVSCFLEGI
jgi:hypothetical protein